MKGALQGEGGGFDFGSNFYYMSLHTLDSKSGISYARSRVMRELLDQWLAKRLAFNGIKIQWLCSSPDRSGLWFELSTCNTHDLQHLLDKEYCYNNTFKAFHIRSYTVIILHEPFHISSYGITSQPNLHVVFQLSDFLPLTSQVITHDPIEILVPLANNPQHVYSKKVSKCEETLKIPH